MTGSDVNHVLSSSVPLGKVLYEAAARWIILIFASMRSSLCSTLCRAAYRQSRRGVLRRRRWDLLLRVMTQLQVARAFNARYSFRIQADMIKDERPTCACPSSAGSLHTSANDADNPNFGLQKHHSIRQQLCRWLLIGLDRLVVRACDDGAFDRQRARVSTTKTAESASSLQNAGITRYEGGVSRFSTEGDYQFAEADASKTGKWRQIFLLFAAVINWAG